MSGSSLRLAVFALALAFFAPPAKADGKAATATNGTVRFAGVNLNLPIPSGYCEIPRSGAGQVFYQLQEHGNAGSNVVAMLFADCKDWQLRERNPNYRLKRHGSYLLQLSEGQQLLAPSGYTRAQYVSQVSGLKVDNEDLRKGVNEKVDSSGLETGKLNSLSIRPIAVDIHAAYLAGVSEVSFPSEKKMVCVVVGATLVKGVPLSLNLYRDYEGTPSILAALEEQKANMSRLDASNP